MKTALIMGINGQDGSYLAEILLEKGYEVHGLLRRSSTGNRRNIDHIVDKIVLHYGDLSDPVSIYSIVNKVRPEEIYNEADQDHAGISFQIPAYNFDVTGAAVGRNLEIIREIDKNIKYFQPVTSNMFGKTNISPQNEETGVYDKFVGKNILSATSILPEVLPSVGKDTTTQGNNIVCSPDCPVHTRLFKSLPNDSSATRFYYARTYK